MMTTREVAAYLGIHEKQVYRLLQKGRLPGTRVTGRWIFSRRFVREWIEAHSRELVEPQAEATHPAEPHHLITVGSDDLLLRIVEREFNRDHPALLATSATMNSEAGISAVAARRAHIAGIHLLDPGSGEYNRPQVAAAFAGRRALLVTLAHRRLGLMLAPGNPHGVTNFEDVITRGLEFASREIGSGVRVLQDHLTKTHGLDHRKMEGREMPFATHLEVATAVLDGRVDAGIGAMASARSLGLDFVPLVWERYDLVTTDEAFYHRPVQAFFELIKSERLRRLVATLPGYDAKDTGLLTVV